jgi:ribosomal-protein-alanine N-acetyltransferase
MERMPFQEHLDTAPTPTLMPVPAPCATDRALSTDWRQALPFISGSLVTLRELRLSDAASLCAMLTTDEVSRFISPPPTTVQGFERFIAWTHRERAAGRYICFAVVPRDSSHAIGLFQIRALGSSFDVAEWGFALGRPYWGTGTFTESANLVLDFAFDVIGVHRLEARAALKNRRGNGALQKIGATQEGVLRRSFCCNGEYLDQALWTILDEDRRMAKAVWGPESRVIH